MEKLGLYAIRMQDFCKSLESNEGIVIASEVYNRPISDLIKAIQCRIYTKGDRQGNVRKIWIDFTDTNTGIQIKHSLQF